jgi:hypothetical protein
MKLHLTDERRGPLPESAVRVAKQFVVLCAVEFVVVAGYLLTSDTAVMAPRYVLYPFVWLNLAVLAVGAVDVPRPTGRRTAAAAAVATVYLGVLAWVSGWVAVGSGGPVSVDLLPAIPGWGPVLLVDGPVALSLVPYETVGYLALTALVYTSIARASAGALSGVLGLVTCVSCVGPVVAATLSGVLGGASTAVAGAASSSYAYDLSTALFVFTIAALWGTLRR